MNLEAKIARIQLNSLPQSIAVRLLKRRDFAALIDSGSADVADVGQLVFAQVRNALADAPIGAFVNVSGSGASGISVARSADALFRVRGSSGAETLLPELSLLDPSKEIRLEGVRYLSDRTLPNWPHTLSWQSAVSQAPLADSDFGLVLDELQGVGEPVIDAIALKLQDATCGVLDIVPTTTTYYESILGPIPWSIGASQYVNNALVPHLSTVCKKSPSWGLRCLQAACIAEAVDPVPIAACVSHDDLLSAIEYVGLGRTPSALLATYKLASSRASIDERFSKVARNALDRLIECTCASENTSDHDALLIALLKLTMSVIGQAEELALAPAFWRRLAAFAHATILLEVIHLPDKAAKKLGAWCAKSITREAAAVQLLDHLIEPGWRVDTLCSRELWASALLRATQTESGNAEQAILSPTQLAQAEPHFRFVAGLPDPLNGARRNWATFVTDVLSENLFDGIDTEKADREAINPIQVWLALAHHAQIYRFDVSLLLRIRGLIRTWTPQAETTFSETCATLALCCSVASTQGDLEIAEAVAARVVEVCDGLTEPADVSLAASIVVLAAGAAKDQPAGLQWAAEKLLALAYRLPRGAPCAALAETIGVFQRLIPLGKRRWGKALVVASSAAG